MAVVDGPREKGKTRSLALASSSSVCDARESIVPHVKRPSPSLHRLHFFLSGAEMLLCSLVYSRSSGEALARLTRQTIGRRRRTGRRPIESEREERASEWRSQTNLPKGHYEIATGGFPRCGRASTSSLNCPLLPSQASRKRGGRGGNSNGLLSASRQKEDIGVGALTSNPRPYLRPASFRSRVGGMFPIARALGKERCSPRPKAGKQASGGCGHKEGGGHGQWTTTTSPSAKYPSAP